jgi:putative flippase GtrA
MITSIFTQISEIQKYVTSHSIRETVGWINSKESPGLIQFVKYGICGIASTIVVLGLWKLLGSTILPCFTGMELADGSLIDEATRKRNNILVNLIAFMPANFVAFFLNVLWVFEPGRHSKLKEFSLFTLISGFSFGAGVIGGPELLIGVFGLPSIVSQLGLVVTSALVNFVCRKMFIFKG